MTPELQAHLDTHCTTLAHCWRVTPQNGAPMGFTDHDRPLTFEGQTFDPRTGAETTEIQARTGLAVDNAEITGALLGDGLSEQDLSAGLYDGAKVETWLANWADPSQRKLIATGRFGTIKRLDGAWQVEVRGIGDELAQTRGRTYGRHCDARLGDARCGIDLAANGMRRTGTITQVNANRIGVAGLDGLANGVFSQGTLRIHGTAATIDIADHISDQSGTKLDLWGSTPIALEPGMAVELTVGCDKSWSTCRTRFANGVNFRGFPHIPGNDFALATAKEDKVHDGSPLVVDHD